MNTFIMDNERTVEVRLAFAFTCPDCGAETYVPSVMHEFSRKEQLELAEEIGERPETGSWITHPEQVTCTNCHADFNAVNPGELIDETKNDER